MKCRSYSHKLLLFLGCALLACPSLLLSAPAPPDPFLEPSPLGGEGDAPPLDADAAPHSTPLHLSEIVLDDGVEPDSEDYWEKFDLYWSGGPAVDQYLIERRISGKDWVVIGTSYQADGSFQTVIPDGLAERRYHYRVVGIRNFSGDASPRVAISNIRRIHPTSWLTRKYRERDFYGTKIGYEPFEVPGEDEDYRRYLRSESYTNQSGNFNSDDYSSRSKYARSTISVWEEVSGSYVESTVCSGSYSYNSNRKDSPRSYKASAQILEGTCSWEGSYTSVNNYGDSTSGKLRDLTNFSGCGLGDYIDCTRNSSLSSTLKTSSRSCSGNDGDKSCRSSWWSSNSLSDEYTTDMLLSDIRENPPEWSDWNDRTRTLLDVQGFLAYGFKDLAETELRYQFTEDEYILTKDRKTRDKSYIVRTRFDPEVEEGQEAQRPEFSYRKLSFSKESSLQTLKEEDFGRGDGVYEVYYIPLKMSVYDSRGQLAGGQNAKFDDIEKELFGDRNLVGEDILPDPSGPTIYYNRKGDSATVIASTALFGHYSAPDDEEAPDDEDVLGDEESTNCKMTISWTGSSLVVTGIDPETGDQEELTSPVIYEDSWKYDHRFTVEVADDIEESRVCFFKMSVEDEFGAFVGTDSVAISIDKYPEIPGSDSPEVYSIPFRDATGPRYRKVALNGRPLSDEKPQATPESDYSAEETYIDAFNLNFVHSVTDLYMPIPGSDLSLSIRRNYQPEIWTMLYGMRPHERSDRSFGSGWSNGGVPYVHFISPVESDVDGFTEPERAIVVDENGSSHEFIRYYGQRDDEESDDEDGGEPRWYDEWVPMPSGKHDAKAYLNTFNGFVFTRKHGTEIRFKGTDISFPIAKHRVNGSEAYDEHRYMRAEKVTDRLGYSIRYDYPIHEDGSDRKVTLIPKRIYATNADGFALPNQQIFIRQEDQQRITHAWDSKGNVVTYDYDTIDFDHPHLGYPQQVHLLTSVTAPDNGITKYTYNGDNTLFKEEDNVQRLPSALPVDHYHIGLSGIRDANSNQYTFDLELDETKSVFVRNEVTSDYYPMQGLPRYVGALQLPGINEKVNFEHIGEERMRVVYDDDGVASLENGDRQTKISDALGNETTYTFGGTEMITLSSFQDFYTKDLTPEELEQFRHKNPRLIYYTTMDIKHGSYGTEHFVFDPNAGLALKSVTDLGGRMTTYHYDNEFTSNSLFRWPDEQSYTHYDDPTKEERPDDTEQYFSYGNFRIMESIIDPRGNKTEYTIDSKGRRTDEKKFDGLHTLVQHTHFDFDDLDFNGIEDNEWSGFVTRKEVISFNDPTWAKSLVTTFKPDSNGRVASSTQYPVVDADGSNDVRLETKFYYDLNNNQTCVVDPRLKETNFAYDSRNRLVYTKFHDGSNMHMVYDPRGNRVGTINENKQVTVTKYDALNRVTDQIQIMSASTLSPSSPNSFINYTPRSDDLVTSNLYNNVNSLIITKQLHDSKKRVTRLEYDDLQRLRFSKNLKSENSGLTQDIITEYIYNANSGGSVFNTSGFKPYQVIDPRGYTTTFTYDGYYRPVKVSTVYDLQTGDQSTTYNDYDDAGNLQLVTDPLGKKTETIFDALNRPTQVVYAKDSTSDETTSHIAYTSTGLQYQVTDEDNNITTTQYDGAGRPIKVIQPSVGVYNGESDTPITKTFYDAAGNVEFTVNPRNERWETIYDDRNRPTSTIQPFVFDYDSETEDTPITVTTYDDLGNVLSVRDPRGFYSYSGYDYANRPIVRLSPAVNIAGESGHAYLATAMIYDRHSNVTEIYTAKLSGLPNLETASRAISVRKMIMSSASVRRSAFNTYDALGRLLTATDAKNITVTNTYDASNNLISVTDHESQQTSFKYDGLSRNTVTEHHDGSSKTLVYNAVNQTSRIDELQQVTNYGYDDRHRLKTVSYLEASDQNRTYTYDDVGNIRKVEEIGKGGIADVEYEYDDLYRIIEETSCGITHKYQYDLAGNRRHTTYDFGGNNPRSMETTYDALNRTDTILENGRTSRYTYDLSGNIREKGQANGDVIIKSYDALGRTTNIRGPDGTDGQPLYLCSNAYDQFGNLAQTFETYPSSDAKLADRTVTNEYDGANRLEHETILTSNAAGQPLTVRTDYGYDGAHNRTSKIVTETIGHGLPTITENATYAYYNDLNQIDRYSDSISARSVDYEYDLNGNRKLADDGIAAKIYTYDRENRLVSVTGGTERQVDASLGLEALNHGTQAKYVETGTTYSYAYDYRTRRVLRDESAAGGSVAYVVFSGGTSCREITEGGTIEGLDADDSLEVDYIRGSDYGGGIGGILYTLRSGTPSFKHYNSRGDIVAATDGTGALTYQAAYEAFGKHGDTPSSEEWGSTLDRQQANTKDEDPTGLLNEGFRYRDLETGTFITRDPLGFVDGPNVYTYVVQNPWTYFDPLGLELLSINPIVRRLLPAGIRAGLDNINSTYDAGVEATSVYSAARETGDGKAQAAVLASAVAVTRATGAMNWAEAVHGEKIVTDASGNTSVIPMESGTEVAMNALGGATGMTLTGVGGAKLLNNGLNRPTADAPSKQKADTPGGLSAKTTAQGHGADWQSASMDKAIKRHAGDNYKMTDTGKKTIYENPDTGIQVVKDNKEGYFRVYDSSNKTYLNMMGKEVKPAFKTGQGVKNQSLRDKDKGAWQRETHFWNSDKKG